MKFMKNVEEDKLSVDDGKLTQDEAQAWTEEFLQSKETVGLNGSWDEACESSRGAFC